MDPLTHALVGSAAARVALARPLGRAAWLPGVAGALLPDADAFIRSSADPLLYAEFHRHFTHAITFIPVGGAAAALPWLAARRTRPRWKAYLAAATAGYGTHGVLDASTTWGTRLWWPFSDARVAWNVIAIVDPMFTLAILAGVALAIWQRRAAPAAAALLFGAAYLGIGAVQRDRALDVQAQIAALRGHDRVRGAVLPGFGTGIVWRSLYQSGDTLYMDRIRVPWSGAASWRPGPRALHLREDDLPPVVRQDPRLRRDFSRFQRFADGWVARAPDEPDVVADGRYSGSTERFEPVWGMRFMPGESGRAVEWIDRSRERRLDLRALWLEVKGEDSDHRPVGHRGR